MMKRLLQWFGRPEIAGDDRDRHRVILLNGVTNAGIAFVLFAVCGNLFDRSTPLRNYLIDLLTLVLFLMARQALRLGKLLLAGTSILTLGYFAVVASIASEGTVLSPAPASLLFVIIGAGIFFEAIGIVTSTVACSLTVLAFMLAQRAGMLPTPDYSPKLLHWFIFTLIFALAGSITYFSNHITMQAFTHAQKELLVRQHTERELKSANEELQQRVIEVERLQAELREQALHDPLTGLHNRRHLAEILSREIMLARRKKECLSILVADVDLFKSVNDTYGHQVGDVFLVEIAQLLKRSVRGVDIVCRYGGEEFVLVLPGTSIEDAWKRGEEIRRKCAELIVQHNGKELSVTLSFGLAGYPAHGEQGEEIIMKADHALYDAKRMGRNQLRVWGMPNRNSTHRAQAAIGQSTMGA